MAHMDRSARITAIAGQARSLYIQHLIARLQREAQRGARWARIADTLIAQDIGLSPDQTKRARLWWASLGVIRYERHGIPPTTEYDVQATLASWSAWLQANSPSPNCAPAHQRLCASAPTFVRQRPNVSAPAHTLDHDDHDDDDRRTHRLKEEITQAENAARALGLDPARIKEECNAYKPRYPDRYYLRTLRQRIEAAQAPLPTPAPGPGSGSRPARPGSGSRTRGTFMRPQVHYTDEQRRAVEERHRAELEAEGYYLKGGTNER